MPHFMKSRPHSAHLKKSKDLAQGFHSCFCAP